MKEITDFFKSLLADKRKLFLYVGIFVFIIVSQGYRKSQMDHADNKVARPYWTDRFEVEVSQGTKKANLLCHVKDIKTDKYYSLNSQTYSLPLPDGFTFLRDNNFIRGSCLIKDKNGVACVYESAYEKTPPCFQMQP